MIQINELPSLNAILNSISAIFLVTGYVMIKNNKVQLHRTCMVSAFVTSTLFLISYLTYHYYAGATQFQGIGVIRVIYFAILISHTFLAASVPILASVTLYRAAKNRFETHKKIARWTLPIWIYVSITGVIIYLMLY